MKNYRLENIVIGIFFSILVAGVFIDVGSICGYRWNPIVNNCD